MEKISSTDRVGNEEVLLTVKGQRNILHEISKRKANWIGHILRRNCLLQWVIEGKIKVGIGVTGRRRRRRRIYSRIYVYSRTLSSIFFFICVEMVTQPVFHQ